MPYLSADDAYDGETAHKHNDAVYSKGNNDSGI